jgi:hypothetical protein
MVRITAAWLIFCEDGSHGYRRRRTATIDDGIGGLTGELVFQSKVLIASHVTVTALVD